VGRRLKTVADISEMPTQGYKRMATTETRDLLRGQMQAYEADEAGGACREKYHEYVGIGKKVAA